MSEMKTVSQDAVKNAGPYLVSLKVSFGPAFSPEKLTHREFITRLREESQKHTKSFLSQMMDHFADHIETAAASGHLSLDHEADMNPNTTYYGHGSCTGCPGDDGTGWPCCLCVYNGQNVGCESC